MLQHTIVEAKMVNMKRKTLGDINSRPLHGRMAQDCSKDVPGARVEASMASEGAKKSFKQGRQKELMRNTDHGDTIRFQQPMDILDGCNCFFFGQMLEDLQTKYIVKYSRVN